jgi:arabinoxylan arabinofuranohydrolase
VKSLVVRAISRMRNASLLFLFPFCLAVSAQKLVTPGYQFNSDPTCREIDGQFYLFTTHDPFTIPFEVDNTDFKGMFDFHAYSTTDFDHWVDHGSVLNTQDAKWHVGTALWDGDAGIAANGRYYAYAPFRVNPDIEDNSGIFKIGVFVSDKVEGPYLDALGKPLTTTDGKDVIGLSPTVVRDDNSQPFLLFGDGNPGANAAYIAKLKANMIELAGPIKEIPVEVHNSCGGLEYFESPILFKRGNLWYLTYVAFNDWFGKNCNFSTKDPPGSYIRYATSKSMFGPFDTNLRTVMFPGAGGTENNQQGVCQYKGNWYIAYHLGRPSSHVMGPYNMVLDHHRQVAVTRLTFEADGSLTPIYPDHDPGVGTPGLSMLTLDAFAHKREAAEFHERLAADAEKGIQGEYHFKMKDGGYLRFNRMDFGKGAHGYRVEVSSEYPSLTHRTLEFRVDGLNGRPIGQAIVSYTGGKTTYSVLTGNLTGAPQGVHDIFLVAHGADGDKEGHLFNIAWFTFTQ